jgi:DNA-3-methyladenine glycosylase
MKGCPDASFYSRPTEVVARELVGKRLARKIKIGGTTARLAGIIVETEAYGHDNDPASHASAGRTRRNAVMFGRVGRAYVYFAYGNHYCVNVSARADDEKAGAVLLRAIRPIEGLEVMKKFRAVDSDLALGSGPGKLTQALNITSSLNGADMTDPESDLHIEFGLEPKRVSATPRVGISRATDKTWRFLDPDSDYVSRKMQANHDDQPVN